MIELGSSKLSQMDIEQIIFSNSTAKLSPNSMKQIEETHNEIKRFADSKNPIYGINTGFGALAEKRISGGDQKTLQKNIILSHAVGVGEPLDFYIAKTLILLRLNTLAQGYSGASPMLTNHLLSLLNANCAPVVPKKGSVGASGDLAPLAHLGLLLLGIGNALIDGETVSANTALKKAEIPPLTLGLRDGLALINGTQAMTSVALVALKICRELSAIADITAGSTLTAVGGHITPFDERIHQIKPHPGQIQTARNIRNITKGRAPEKMDLNFLTQDPYSLRCVPQVHGATKDVIAHVLETTLREINSVTDNPLIFLNKSAAQPDILSGGNFHGQYMALALDYLAMAMAELANISERRIELLLNPEHSNGLPAFLIADSGLNSGYMMMQVTASALVNENKVLCHPASTDSIPTSANREDHVSMGMTSANKLMQVIENTKTVLAIEIMAAHQGLSFRPKDSLGNKIQKLNESIREAVAFRTQDGLYSEDLQKTLTWLDYEGTKQLIASVLEDN